MKRLGIAIATGVVLAALVVPSVALANCGGDACTVGGAGVGGVNSDGKAQGFRIEGSANTSDGYVVYTNVGNADGGRIWVSGGRVGTLAGTYRDGVGRGRGTGYFGDWTGLCPC
jgi:hypothetical protein